MVASPTNANKCRTVTNAHQYSACECMCTCVYVYFCVYASIKTYHVDMRRIEVLALDAKATYKVNHPYEMIQNICPHDAMQPISMVQLIAIVFQHIYLADPIILFVHIRMLSEAERK